MCIKQEEEISRAVVAEVISRAVAAAIEEMPVVVSVPVVAERSQEDELVEGIMGINLGGTYVENKRKPGGAKTNENGLRFEAKTRVMDAAVSKSVDGSVTFEYEGRLVEMAAVEKKKLREYMGEKRGETLVPLDERGHGCKEPDEAYVYLSSAGNGKSSVSGDKRGIIYIIEKKFQTQGGSVVEKLQTTEFKMRNYRRQYSRYEIVYIYVLSKWFKRNAKVELEGLLEAGVPVFWGEEEGSLRKVVDYMCSRAL